MLLLDETKCTIQFQLVSVLFRRNLTFRDGFEHFKTYDLRKNEEPLAAPQKDFNEFETEIKLIFDNTDTDRKINENVNKIGF